MSAPLAISSRANPRWQRLRKLAHNPSAYREHNEVWVEGEHLCIEVVRRGRSIRCAVIGETAWQQPQLRQLAQAAAEIMLLPDPLLAALSGMDSAPPLAFVLEWPGAGAIDADAPSVVLDRLQDAGNVGTILRSAAAFGFTQVIALKGSAALWSPKVLRSAMGAHFGLRLVEGRQPADLTALRVPMLATSSHGGQTIDAVRLPWPCCWVMGHEGQGLAAAIEQQCGQTLRIAQPGGMESLNVAAAASICLYESARQRLGAVPHPG